MLDSTTLAAIIQMVGALIIAIVLTGKYEKKKQELDRANAFRELFNSFNLRFNALNKVLNEVLDLSDTRKSAGVQLYFTDLTSEQRDKVQDYLNLCSEEFLWKRKGFIDDDVWIAWKLGLSYYLQADPIKELFRREKNGPYRASYYEGFFQEITDILPE